MSTIIQDAMLSGMLPRTFLHGYASASYQIEGGYQQDGRGPSNWDEVLKDMANGNEADNSYNLWRDDIELLKRYGATSYRFSISWSRVIPLGKSFPRVIEVLIADTQTRALRR